MKSVMIRSFLLLCVSSAVYSAVTCSVHCAETRTQVRDTDYSSWPVLKCYDGDHLARIALPIGGIGTGTVSLGGRGDLRDWEIMNRPAKGFVPKRGGVWPFFAVFLRTSDGNTETRALEGPIERSGYEESHGSIIPNHGLPRFRECSFETAYPFGQVILSDPDVPVDVRIKAFNPLIPTDPDASGIPVAILRYELHNRTDTPVTVSVCGTMPNFIGMDGSETEKDWRGEPVIIGAKSNRNEYRNGENVRGIFMYSDGVVDPKNEQWGTIALTTTEKGTVTYRTGWLQDAWGNSLLDFWDDFSKDGTLEERESTGEDMPVMSIAAGTVIPPQGTETLTFLLTWHFPNRRTWTPKDTDEDMLTNYYTTQYHDAWEVAETLAVRLEDLERDTLQFVRAFLASPLPETVKEAALFNISTLRTQTCFRTADGMFFGWEGSSNYRGCCFGSCTHVWNYEQATAFLFGDLAKKMREVEFGHATDENGLMSFRVGIPLGRACDFGKAAADGQMGCIMKMYRDWKLSGDGDMLKRLWPNVRKALEFCWIPGGWDADCDGVMEGCQHNTMDVEYYGPNPQMEIWYLGALRAAEEMARYLGDTPFARTCRSKFTSGSAWTDSHLFNGEYYEHLIQPPGDPSKIAPSLQVGMGASDLEHPDFQLGSGCLVDQLVGQFMAHVCGLGYLVDSGHVRTTLKSIMKYNYRDGFTGHFNCLRSFAMGDESALLMASYPKDRPVRPFPYFTEVMTGFEYAAAVGMLYEGLTDDGLRCISNIRDRYDGLKRSPFDEAECGHHYARAMASWASVLALTGFSWSGVDNAMTFSPLEGACFWSNGYAYGTVSQTKSGRDTKFDLKVIKGSLNLKTVTISGVGSSGFKKARTVNEAEEISLTVRGR